MLHTLRDSGHWICATHCCCPLPIIQITECVGWKLKGHLLAKISYSIVLQNKDNSASGLFYNGCTFAKATLRFRGNGNLNVAFAKNGENIFYSRAAPRSLSLRRDNTVTFNKRQFNRTISKAKIFF